MSIPTSLIFVVLVAAWLTVLVPMVARRREPVPEVEVDSGTFRVLRRASASIRRRPRFSRHDVIDAADDDDDLDSRNVPIDDELDEELLDDEDGELMDEESEETRYEEVRYEEVAHEAVQYEGVQYEEVQYEEVGDARYEAAEMEPAPVRDRGRRKKGPLSWRRPGPATSVDADPGTAGVDRTSVHERAVDVSAADERAAHESSADESSVDETMVHQDGYVYARYSSAPFEDRDRGGRRDPLEGVDQAQLRPVPRRQGRGGYDPDAAELARAYRYSRRRRVTVILLLVIIAFSAAAYLFNPVLWSGTVVFGLLLAAYLGYLRRQVRIENDIRQRRLARLRRARQIRPEYHLDRPEPVTGSGFGRRDLGTSQVPPSGYRRGREIVDLEDDDPSFDDLDHYQPIQYRHASGQ